MSGINRDIKIGDIKKLTNADYAGKIYNMGNFRSPIPFNATGAEQNTTPFYIFDTAQREFIAASQKNQRVNHINPDVSRCRTGCEQEIEDYLIQEGRVPENGAVVAFIPNLNFGIHDPELTGGGLLIYERDDRTLDCIILKDYQYLSKGIGYMTRKSPYYDGMLQAGNPLTKDDWIRRSPTITDDGLIAEGLSAKFCTLTIPFLDEDACMISESLSERSERHGFEEYDAMLAPNESFLDIYGDGNIAKAIPEIGESVGEDGILLAIRKHTSENLAAVVNPDVDDKVLAADDRFIRTRPGSVVVGVEVYFKNDGVARAAEKEGGPLAQLAKFHHARHEFVEELLAVYNRYRNRGFEYTPRLNDLITRALAWKEAVTSRSKRRSALEVVYKDQKVQKLYVKIHTRYTECAGIGAKIAGDTGDKNINCIVLPDKYMPGGCDICMATNSMTNRMNLAQGVTAFINCASAQIRDRLIDGEFGEGLEAWDTIREFICDVCPDQVSYLDAYVGDDDHVRMSILDGIIDDGFYHHFGKANVDMTPERLLFLKRKYNITKSTITYAYPVNGEIKWFETELPVMIGEKQIYVLGKLPDKQLAAQENSHINQFGIPIKASSKEIKDAYLSPATPIRFGFDELSGLLAVMPTKSVARLVMLHASNMEAIRLCNNTLLTAPKPTAIRHIEMMTDDMIRTSDTIRSFVDILSVGGLDARNDVA